MAHGEAEHGCAQGEPCRLGHHEQHTAGRHPRRSSGTPHDLAGWPTERGEDEPIVPRQRTEENEPGYDPQPGCRSELPGWAGAHRHGGVRPGSRRSRRERPPQRWC